ncbi:MAG: tyrosine-type recombinase/integrase [Nitrosopumilaceae archaeon]|nr:tyrosine-type recombinase/integrase [Nitrosopumilaceae archaeon]
MIYFNMLHYLRHTCATRLVESGIPLHTVAKLLGHSSVRTTERYSHPENTCRCSCKNSIIYKKMDTNCSKNCSNKYLILIKEL